MIFQMTGLSGAGKTTIATHVREKLLQKGYKVEVLDGDIFRKNLGNGLGFSKEDRCENIRRMGYVAHLLAQNDVVCILAAINPYEEIRNELTIKYQARTIFVSCDLQILKQRDTKGLYKRAFLPENHPDKILNLTGVNDPFDTPDTPDLLIQTDTESIDSASQKVVDFILFNWQGRMVDRF